MTASDLLALGGLVQTPPIERPSQAEMVGQQMNVIAIKKIPGNVVCGPL